MDWLVAGGFLGLIAYLSIFGACLWYLLIRPIVRKDDETFTVLERGVLLGILAGYFTHNIVVFDNIVSYIFFAIILGLINARVGIMPKAISEFKVDKAIITQFVAPVVAAALVAGIYFFHLPGMQAASDLIVAFRSPDPAQRLEGFKVAVERDSFAHQEITEQLAQQTMGVIRNTEIPEEVRTAYAAYTEEQLERLMAEKPGDARVYVFVGSYYRTTNDLEKAAEYMALAREASPHKQPIIIQQGFVALSLMQVEEAAEFFKTAFELDTRNLEAREYYAAALFYADEPETAMALLKTDNDTNTNEDIMRRFAASDFLIGTANQFGQTDFVIELFEYRAYQDTTPQQTWANNPQTWASLAFLYYQQENNERAIEVLKDGGERIPTFASSADCFAENIANGREPQVGCVAE